jgi:hypothetical protein
MNAKVIGTQSEMSNLVGMYAFLLKDEKIEARIHILGKANNENFICQIISPFNGHGNICKLMSVEALKEWTIIPTFELANEIYNDYLKNGWRYSYPF